MAITPKTDTLFPVMYTIDSKVDTQGHARVTRIAQWLERRTRDRKVAGSNPRRSGGRNFFSRVYFLC